MRSRGWRAGWVWCEHSRCLALGTNALLHGAVLQGWLLYDHPCVVSLGSSAAAKLPCRITALRVAQNTRHAGRGACWLLFKRLSVPWAPHALLGRDRSALVCHNWAWWRRSCCTHCSAPALPLPAACAAGRSFTRCRSQQCCGGLGTMPTPAAGTVAVTAAAAATQAKLRKAPAARSFSQSRITTSFRAPWAPAGPTGVTQHTVPLVLWRTTL